MYGLWPEAWLRLHAHERDDRARSLVTPTRSLAMSTHSPRTRAVVTSPAPAVVAPCPGLACC